MDIWEKVKMYLIQAGLKKYLPMGIMAAIASLGTFLAAHSGMLEQYGITYGIWPINWPQPPTGPVIVVELDTLKTAAIVGIPALVTIVMRAVNHHTTGTPIIQNQREGDPK